MAISAFVDKSAKPTDAALKKVLGGSHPLWTGLRRQLTGQTPALTEEWGYTSAKTGWGLRLKNGVRTILSMTPCEGYFLASTALGEKAVNAAQASSLSAGALKIIDEAKRYAEGRGVRFEVRTTEDVADVRILVQIKLAH